MLNDRHVNLSQFAERLFAANDPALSQDLEQQLQDAGVCDGDGLQDFLAAHLEGIAPAESVIVCLGVRLGESRGLEGALALDAEVDTMPWTPKRREASQRMGRQALQLAASVIDSPLLLAFSIRAEAGTTPCHHPLVFGFVAGRLGWPAQATAEGYLQGSAAAVVAAAARRMPLTAEQAQETMWSVGDEITRLARKAAAAEAGAVWSFTAASRVPVPA